MPIRINLDKAKAIKKIKLTEEQSELQKGLNSELLEVLSNGADASGVIKARDELESKIADVDNMSSIDDLKKIKAVKK